MIPLANVQAGKNAAFHEFAYALTANAVVCGYFVFTSVMVAGRGGSAWRELNCT